MVLINRHRLVICSNVTSVSVPLRGLWFLSGRYIMEPKILVKVSVPLRGLWFLSPYVPCGRCLSAPTRFRPLTGIMVLIIVEQVKRKSGGIVSVPLRGLWFLSILNTTIQLVSFFVSVPLRGLWFLYAPLINGFIAPSKMPFAGRIFFSHHFSHFCGK